MLSASLKVALLASASLIEARSVFDVNHLHGGVLHRRQNTDLTATVLAANAIQTGSFLDGSNEIGAAEVGQALSKTSTNNFINNCSGKTLTNGLQIVAGSCNGIPMGDIPAKTAMVSSIITFPVDASATIQSDTTFNITVQMANLVAGSFTNADATYYSAPQQLQGGQVVGHTHVTVQDMGASLNPTTALDPTQFAFFKGINDAGNGKGLLQATVTGGLPAGNYRVCTMASASNHQPVLMPVAQRGTADDCSKFTVVGSGTTANAASNDGSGGEAAAAAAQSAVDNPGPTGAAVQGNGASSSASVASATTKAGKGAKVQSSISVTTSSAVKVAPFSNTTSIAASATAIAGNGGKGGKGAQASTTEADSGSVTLSSAGSASSPTKVSGGGKAVNSQGSSSGGIVAQKVTVVETFFIFVKSLGGLPPSVSKQGESFFCFGELFDDISSAASAACGHQFDACASFSGPGFSFEECASQKDDCGSAASVASAPPAPSTVTATVTVPVSATVTGSVISETTVSVSASSVAGNVAAVQTSSVVASETTSVKASSTPSAAKVASPLPPFSNSTAKATGASSANSASSTSTSTSSSSALGVNGNTFVAEAAAVQRSCDVQFNACANAVNGGTLSGVTVADCQTQKNACGQ
ncbi:hypothetical protein LSUB1_G004182 [Lachnellula subtilissima]|uniref:Uncharacterized protein n=1 Tax=Lachnellula subtilissima TaxID=602034 RepID=A0A8H8RS91_9HELO|nr:hypothetical protein LSUB1_G004182 [Lachnellula subtilissima]